MGAVMLWHSRLAPQNAVLRSPPDGSGGGFGLPNRAVGNAVRPGAEPRLDTTAKSVGRSDVLEPRKQGRKDRFRWQRHAAGLLGGKARVGLCRWSLVSRAAGVDVVTTTYPGANAVYAHFQGLQTCGSVWDCPCCAARISETRRAELNQLLIWARSQKHTVQMVTLTARHGRHDDLADLLDRMKRAKQKWAQHRAYKRLKVLIVGSVTATEVTGGGVHGWHPHFHVLFVTSGPVDLHELRDAWLASLRGVGLDGTGAGWRVQDATEAGRYVGKWGAAEEVALGAKKKARGGMSPTQLLAASSDQNDKRAGALWREYSAAFRGRRQLVWSRGLKAMAGVGEVSDADAATDEQQDDQQEEGRVNVTADEWSPKHGGARGAQHRRARVLDAAETEGEAGVRRVVSETGTDEDPDCVEVIELDLEPERWKPRPGGLAAIALAAIMPLPGQGP